MRSSRICCYVVYSTQNSSQCSIQCLQHHFQMTSGDAGKHLMLGGNWHPISHRNQVALQRDDVGLHVASRPGFHNIYLPKSLPPPQTQIRLDTTRVLYIKWTVCIIPNLSGTQPNSITIPRLGSHSQPGTFCFFFWSKGNCFTWLALSCCRGEMVTGHTLTGYLPPSPSPPGVYFPQTQSHQ